MTDLRGLDALKFDLMMDKHQDVDHGFEIYPDGSVTVRWGGYDYELYAEQVDTPIKCLGFIAHMGLKTWEEMTAERLAELIERLAKFHGWNIH